MAVAITNGPPPVSAQDPAAVRKGTQWLLSGCSEQRLFSRASAMTLPSALRKGESSYCSAASAVHQSGFEFLSWLRKNTRFVSGHAFTGCGKMRFRNLVRYYCFFRSRAGGRFPTVIQRDSVAELGIFPQPVQACHKSLNINAPLAAAGHRFDFFRSLLAVYSLSRECDSILSPHSEFL